MSHKLTVVMAVYNAMPYLEAAIASVLNQSFSDFQLIVIDDGSTDGSGAWLDHLSDARLHLIHQQNRGQGYARSRGFSHCTSPLTAVMDADDVALPGRFAAQVAFLEQNQQVGLVGTQFRYLGNSGHQGFGTALPTEHEAILSALMMGRHAIVNSSIMCQTSVLQRIGGYRIGGSGEDWDLFLRVAEISKLANLSEVYYLYRVHSDSVSVKKLAEIRQRYAHSIHCASLRVRGLPEISYESFIAMQRHRPLAQRLLDHLDTVALVQYRMALPDALGHHRVRGYARLVLAAACSPRWTAQYLRKRVKALVERPQPV